MRYVLLSCSSDFTHTHTHTNLSNDVFYKIQSGTKNPPNDMMVLIFSRNGTEANRIKYKKQNTFKNKSMDMPCFHPDWIEKSISDGELANTWSYVVGEEDDYENLTKELEKSCRNRKIPGTRKKADSWIEL